jgi:hypothetical protein
MRSSCGLRRESGGGLCNVAGGHAALPGWHDLQQSFLINFEQWPMSLPQSVQSVVKLEGLATRAACQ